MIEERVSLSERETLFEAALQHATIGICIATEYGRIEMINRPLQALLKYSANELTGQPVEAVIPGIVRFRNYSTGKFASEDNLSEQRMETRALGKGNYRLQVEISLTSCRSDARNYIIVFIIDVTEKKFLEDKLKALFYKSPAAKCLTEFKTAKIIDTNSSFCRFSGFAREELEGKTLVDLGIISSDTQEKWRSKLLTEGRISNADIEVVTRHKQHVFALFSAEQIEISGDRFILLTCIDITELKKANEALRNAKENLEEEATELSRLNETGNRLWKIDNLKDGLKEILDSSIELTRAKKGNIQLYDAGREMLVMDISRNFSEAFLHHFKEATVDSGSTCGIALRSRTRCITQDTEKEWQSEDAVIARAEGFRSVLSTPLFSRDGALIGMISNHFKDAGAPSPLILKRMELYALVAENFIDRLKSYETIKTHNIELEEKVAQRTRELLASLRQEKELSEMKSRFLSMASHEFRTPLTTIRSSLTLIQAYHQDDQIEKRNKHVSRIEASVAAMVDILTDLLSLEKLEKGKVEAVPVSFNLRQFAENIMDEFNSVLKKGQHIQLYYDGERDIIQDEKVLGNVLRNLLSNAIKYSSEEKEIVFAVVARGRISITIKDNGIGIPEEEQARIFSTFFRAKNAGSVQGTGLGLSIVKRYMELLNGSVHFVSELHKGTAFTITFPQHEERGS